MIKLLGFLLVFWMGVRACMAQSCGCKDMQAINFDPSAQVSDGSCLYKEAAITPSIFHQLPKVLEESSGVVFVNGKIYTHNDSGNPHELYEISEDHDSIVHRIKILGIQNDPDWEDICSDGKYIYISDAGNNRGNRTDLNIVRVPLSKLHLDSVQAEFIQFRYPDQVSFVKGKHSSNFDGEAIYFANDSLHLFTKNWQNQKTKHYTLPITPGIYTASLIDSFDTKMLITGADISADGKEVVLCGYDREGKAGIWLLWNFKKGQIFSGNKRKITFGETAEVGQLEAVCFRDNQYLYITNEKFMEVKQTLSGVDLSELFRGFPGGGIDKEFIADVNIYPNTLDHCVNAEIVCVKDLKADIYIVNEWGKILYSSKQYAFTNGYNQVKLVLDELRVGTYMLMVRLNGASLVNNKFVVRE